jgi:hypothetical protein
MNLVSRIVALIVIGAFVAMFLALKAIVTIADMLSSDQPADDQSDVESISSHCGGDL